MTGSERALGRGLLPCAIAAIVALTLTPSWERAPVTAVAGWCFRCGDYGTVDVVLNTLLFVPFGLALALTGASWWRVVLVALCVTTGIEALQLTVVPGRDASLSDLVTNVTGAALGALLAFRWHQLVFAPPSRAWALFAGIALSWSASRVGTSWLLRASFPDTRWFGQVAPKDIYPSDFRGTVVHGAFGSVTARSAEMPALRDVFLAPEGRVLAVVRGTLPTQGLASILSVMDERRSELLVLAQHGTDARLRLRLRSTDLLLRTPSVRIEDAFRDRIHEVRELSGWWAPGALMLRSSSGDRTTSATLSLGPGLGWAFLLPFDAGLTPAVSAVGTAAVSAAIMFVLGFLARRAVPDRPRLALAFAIMIGGVGLWLPVIVFSEASIAVSEVLAATVGASLGALLQRRTDVSTETLSSR